MVKQIDFSIIIPALNEEKYISSCLKSVLDQDFPKDRYEIIVVDNNSQDKTSKIVAKFPVKLVKEAKRGLVMARNKGLIISKGDVIINLDADCEAPKDWLKKIDFEFKKDPNLALLTGPCIPKPGEKNLIDYFSIFLTTTYYTIFKKTFVFWGGNTAIKKRILKLIGGYNLTNPYHDELSLLKKINRIGKAVFKPDLKIYSSNRRVKGRVLKFVFKEVIFLYFMNNLYNKITKKTWSQWEIVR